MEKLKITFIQTGGTIDEDYPHTTKGWAFEIGEPAVKNILEKLNPSFEYEIAKAFAKDSLDITEEDREVLARLIEDSDNRRFIITHGTDTMIETADYLNSRIKDKLVVITGAMLPQNFRNSDAEVNLGCAIATANLINSGIFIAMHGIVKPAMSISRDMETGKYD